MYNFEWLKYIFILILKLLVCNVFSLYMYSTWLKQLVIRLHWLLCIKLNIEKILVFIDQMLKWNLLLENQQLLSCGLPRILLEILIFILKLILKHFLLFLILLTVLAESAAVVRVAEIYDILLVVVLIFYWYFNLYFVGLVLGLLLVIIISLVLVRVRQVFIVIRWGVGIARLVVIVVVLVDFVLWDYLNLLIILVILIIEIVVVMLTIYID